MAKAAGVLIYSDEKGRQVKFTYIGAFYGPGGLNKDMTIDDLISLIARKSRFTEDEIEESLLAVINALTDEEDD